MKEVALELSDMANEPFAQFTAWFAAAQAAGVAQPEAMTLATVDESGLPDARTVLLRQVVAPPHGHPGFCFFTNHNGDKGRQLAARPVASLLFHWEPLARQVRIRGDVQRLSPADNDGYFATRPRGSQLGAWASPQSQVIASRHVLDARVDDVTARFGEGPVPRPPHWGGYIVVPRSVEFWQGRTYRLHDRIRYDRVTDGWIRVRLAP